jgi:hypothetical protein
LFGCCLHIIDLGEKFVSLREKEFFELENLEFEGIVVEEQRKIFCFVHQ